MRNSEAQAGHGGPRGGLRFGRLIAGTVALAALTGCTSLSVMPDRVFSADRGMALSGAPYALPMLQYKIEATRILSACPQPVTIEGHPASGKFWSGQIALEMEAIANPTQIAGERYLVNYSKLDSWFKTTNFAVEYQPGTDILKSINVSAQDNTGEIAGNVLKAGLTVAAAASGPAGAAAVAASSIKLADTKAMDRAQLQVLAKDTGLSENDAKALNELLKNNQIASAHALLLKHSRSVEDELANTISNNSSEAQTILACHESVLDDVLKREEIAKQLKAEGETLKAANTALERRTRLAEVGGLNAQGRTDLGKALDDVTKSEAALAKLKQDLATVEKRLGAVTKAVWPTSFAQRKTDDLAALGNDETKRLAALLRPVTVRVIQEQRLADDLASSPERLKAFRTIAKDFVDRYVDSDGRAKRFRPVPLPGKCVSGGSGTLVAGDCIAALATLSASLQPVATDFLPDCPKESPECRKSLSNDGNAKRSDFPRQVQGRGTSAMPGLFVRTPVRAELTICRTAPAGDETAVAPAPDPYAIRCAQDESDLIEDDTVLAPQLGQLRFIRLVNEPFSNNALSLSLSKEGMIEKFQYGSSSAIAKSLADAATQGAAFYEKRRAEFLANTDPTSLAQKQIALKEATNKLALLNAAPVADPMKAIALAKAEAEVELLRAQINSLNAQTAARTAPAN